MLRHIALTTLLCLPLLSLACARTQCEVDCESHMNRCFGEEWEQAVCDDRCDAAPETRCDACNACLVSAPDDDACDAAVFQDECHEECSRCLDATL